MRTKTPTINPYHRNIVTTFAYHPDGTSFRGVADCGRLVSVCKHAHRTVDGAERCARSKAASFRRGEWGQP